MSVAVQRLTYERQHGVTGHLDCGKYKEEEREVVTEEEFMISGPLTFTVVSMDYFPSRSGSKDD